VHVCFYAAPFGVVPMELDEVYPLSQHETVLPLDKETVEYVAEQVSSYIMVTSSKNVILVNDKVIWNNFVLKACKKACAKKNVRFECVSLRENTGKACKKDPAAEGKGLA
jgi:predicted RNA-binding protein